MLGKQDPTGGTEMSKRLPTTLFIPLCLAGCISAQPASDDVRSPSGEIHAENTLQSPPAEPLPPAETHASPETPPPAPKPARSANCPADRMAGHPLPGMSADDFSPKAWSQNKRTVLSQKAIERQNARFYAPMNDLDASISRDELVSLMTQRLQSFRQKFQDGDIMFEDGSVPPESDWETPLHEFSKGYDPAAAKQHILLEDATILCGPHDRPYIRTQNGEVRFSRNNCSLGRAQARIEILFEHANGMKFVRTSDMWGWLSPNAKLSPELDARAKGDREARWFTTNPMTLAGMQIPKGAFLAGTKHEILVATQDGFETLATHKLDGIADTRRPLTRKDWIQTLFLFADDPYGWGGHDGWRDCSRLMLDSARAFGLRLPRNSKEQAIRTSYYLNVAGMAPEDKLRKIEDAAKTGIVLLHFPGHIMAWLGKKQDGTPVVYHALSEYLEACPDGAQVPAGETLETLVHVDRVTISSLALGQNTSRGSFLERITHISVLADMTRELSAPTNLPWASAHDWTPQEETLYAAFVERLFDYPDEPDKSWTNLGDVLRDKDHNILYNALGQNEDNALRLAPDCADLPYMLRAYFAWKRGLPMAVRKCDRGNNDRAPRCGTQTLQDSAAATNPQATDDKRFNKYAQYVGGYMVHSGNARTALDDDSTDFYPVALDRNSLRPGTTYADPYGHLLMIAQYTPDTPESPGALLAADAQPDGTITRKRFWRGNFLFAPEIKNVGAGFKAFRPIVNGQQLTNEQLTPKSGFVPYSSEQSQISRDTFYDRVEAAIHPKPLAIEQAIAELTDALRESAEKRVLSVQNGDDYARAHGSADFVMPNGYTIFETTGPWEDFATPSRDMRMLIAIDAVRDFPDQIARNATRYGLANDADIQNAVTKARADIQNTLEHSYINYINSAGTPVKLSIYQIMQRADALEMAYHPADCNEIRWGAPPDSDEYQTCSRTASASERTKMNNMRKWFKLRIRPPR